MNRMILRDNKIEIGVKVEADMQDCAVSKNLSLIRGFPKYRPNDRSNVPSVEKTIRTPDNEKPQEVLEPKIEFIVPKTDAEDPGTNEVDPVLTEHDQEIQEISLEPKIETEDDFLALDSCDRMSSITIDPQKPGRPRKHEPRITLCRGCPKKKGRPRKDQPKITISGRGRPKGFTRSCIKCDPEKMRQAIQKEKREREWQAAKIKDAIEFEKRIQEREAEKNRKAIEKEKRIREVEAEKIQKAIKKEKREQERQAEKVRNAIEKQRREKEREAAKIQKTIQKEKRQQERQAEKIQKAFEKEKREKERDKRCQKPERKSKNVR